MHKSDTKIGKEQFEVTKKLITRRLICERPQNTRALKWQERKVLLAAIMWVKSLQISSKLLANWQLDQTTGTLVLALLDELRCYKQIKKNA